MKGTAFRITSIDSEKISLEDIEQDIVAQNRASAMIVPASVHADAFAERILARRSAGRSGLESAPVERLGLANRRRLNTLVFLENSLAESGDEVGELDFGPLVMLGCQIVEDEICRLIAPASKRGGEQLLSVLTGERLEAVVAGWLQGRVPWTLGTLQAILVAWRRLCSVLSGPGTAQIAVPFSNRYRELLESRGLERSVALLRNEYRNPIAHGSKACSMADAEECASLVVGVSSFSIWVQRGVPRPDPTRALLHHHLLNVQE